MCLKRRGSSRSYTLFSNPIEVGCILRQPRLFDFRDVSNEGLSPCLHYFVEDDPIRFTIL